MKNIISLLKKSSLYLAAMMLALAVTYYLGLAPLLHAQADFPDMPAFPEVKPTSPTAQPAAPPPGKPAASDIPDMPEDASAAAQPAPPKPVAPPPPSRPNISPATGILFKHTKSYVGELSNPDRDPFRKPLYILELEEKSLKPQKTEEVRIDDKIEAIRRWPLRDYRLVGVIWDVKSPKAMIVDPSNTMHLLKRNYRIGDKDGIISAISEGAITVIQDNIPVVMDISSGNK